MAQRLVKAGMRPISNVVDVTNYVLLERNQPLHAFDLCEARWAWHRASGSPTDGERITTLDGVERELTSEDLLICDAERVPQAIAGDHGRIHLGGQRHHFGDPARVGLLRSHGDRQDVEAAEAPQ